MISELVEDESAADVSSAMLKCGRCEELAALLDQANTTYSSALHNAVA